MYLVCSNSWCHFVKLILVPHLVYCHPTLSRSSRLTNCLCNIPVVIAANTWPHLHSYATCSWDSLVTRLEGILLYPERLFVPLCHIWSTVVVKLCCPNGLFGRSLSCQQGLWLFRGQRSRHTNTLKGNYCLCIHSTWGHVWRAVCKLIVVWEWIPIFTLKSAANKHWVKWGDLMDLTCVNFLSYQHDSVLSRVQIRTSRLKSQAAQTRCW